MSTFHVFGSKEEKELFDACVCLIDEQPENIPSYFLKAFLNYKTSITHITLGTSEEQRKIEYKMWKILKNMS